jgi:hypothetical protein
MELASEDLQYVNKENNISNRSYNQKIPEFKPLFRNDYSRKRRRR